MSLSLQCLSFNMNRSRRPGACSSLKWLFPYNLPPVTMFIQLSGNKYHLSVQLQLPNLLYKLLLFFLFSCWWQNHLIDFQLLKLENWFHILSFFLVFLPRVSATWSKYNFHPPSLSFYKTSACMRMLLCTLAPYSLAPFRTTFVSRLPHSRGQS